MASIKSVGQRLQIISNNDVCGVEDVKICPLTEISEKKTDVLKLNLVY